MVISYFFDYLCSFDVGYGECIFLMYEVFDILFYDVLLNIEIKYLLYIEFWIVDVKIGL